MAFANIASRVTQTAPPRTGKPRHPVFWMHPVAAVQTVAAAPGAAARALAEEIAVRAERFFRSGESAIVDLRFLKSMPEERKILANLLGRGEVSVVLDCLGRTEIQETAVPCVWMTRHCNSEGETVGELVEITGIPDEIAGDRQAVARGIDALRARLADWQA